MTNLIATDTQGQEISSGLVDLFELTTASGTFYFHAGLDTDLTNVQFRDREAPYAVRTYIAIPILLDGVEISSSGAANRPTLTVANVTSDLKTATGIINYDELVGSTLVRRQTLKKYLVGESPDQSNPPIELNSVRYKIDRVSNLTNIAVTFELAVVYDLEGIQLPRRVVVGKFCSWMYQGFDLKNSGGCIWKSSSTINTLSSSNTSISHNLFFDENDIPLILTSLLVSNSTNWASGQAYTQSSYVKYPATGLQNYYRCEIAHTSSVSKEPTDNTGHWTLIKPYTVYSASTTYAAGSLVQATTTIEGKTLTTIWRSLTSGNAGNTPSVTSGHWERAELCGKKLSSCKCRFQARMISNDVSSLPTSAKNTGATLPFGGFPGTGRF